MKDRITRIVECVEEINAAVAKQKAGDWNSFLWEMDQRGELHRLLFEPEQQMNLLIVPQPEQMQLCC